MSVEACVLAVDVLGCSESTGCEPAALGLAVKACFFLARENLDCFLCCTGGNAACACGIVAAPCGRESGTSWLLPLIDGFSTMLPTICADGSCAGESSLEVLTSGCPLAFSFPTSAADEQS